MKLYLSLTNNIKLWETEEFIPVLATRDNAVDFGKERGFHHRFYYDKVIRQDNKITIVSEVKATGLVFKLVLDTNAETVDLVFSDTIMPVAEYTVSVRLDPISFPAGVLSLIGTMSRLDNIVTK